MPRIVRGIFIFLNRHTYCSRFLSIYLMRLPKPGHASGHAVDYRESGGRKLKMNVVALRSLCPEGQCQSPVIETEGIGYRFY